ncbi:unnamed protein product [Brachionus calyciflorus]|uniref:Uncharacterized protein n=1 Tax=Brachionus calyciflorus TaxID=104777 RepID=A0A813Y5T7_9BILA|nr:unnamed protein product [Brachionus calyciflorus]
MDRKIRRSVSNADRLRELLDISNDNEKSTLDQVKSRHNFKETPQIDDLIRLIQSTESVNQQLLIENKFLKDETQLLKTNILNLVNENSLLHKELKNATVLEILNEVQTNPNFTQNQNNSQTDASLKEELHQSQLLINELQKKLELALKTKSHLGSNTLDQIESDPLIFNSKFNEELEIKLRQIDSLKNEIDLLNKSKVYMKNKLEECEAKENELLSQIKKYVDLVKHLEMEKNQAYGERDIYREDKINTDKKLETILRDFNEKILSEKEIILENVESQIKKLTEENQILEERSFKQENLIDRLTRDKIDLISELESYKQKCNSIDFDTHRMAETLRNKYLDVLKERDILLQENKRVRHDYDLYVKQNDQDKFCLRDELNTTRNRLLDVEKDLINSQEQCIKLTEQLNKLEADIVSIKHSKEVIENQRQDNIKQLTNKYQERESQLAQGIEAIQARYCLTVKELEELVDSQKKLINNLRSELKTCNEQLELLALKYKQDVEHLSNQCYEMTIRLGKYETRVNEYEMQNVKHNELHDKMKDRLKELTTKIQFQQDALEKSKSNETLMTSTNLQLIQEVSSLKDQIKLLKMPNRNTNNVKKASQAENSYNSLNNMLNMTSRIDLGTINTVRSAIENSLYSMKSN